MTASFGRRRALTGTAALALGVPVLAACGGSGDDTTTDAAGSSSRGDAGADGGPLASVSDVPVDGCFVVSAAKVVLTQPEEGEFKAFDATCTHQGCLVSSGSDGVIPCGCHGSRFSLEDGSVVQGPATSGLAEVEIVVDGDSIALA